MDTKSSLKNSVDFSNYNNSTRSKVRERTFFGFLLIFVGIIFLSFNFGWIDSSLKRVIISWPMILIVLSIVNFIKKELTTGVVLLIFGLFFLMPRLAEVYPESFSYIDIGYARTYWPVILIIVGLFIVLRIGKRNGEYVKNQSYRNIEEHHNEGGRIDKSVVFGGSETIFLDPLFYGGSIKSTFGGVLIDLRKAALPEGETYLNVSAIFGGVELYVPDEWLIDNRLHAILSGVEDKRRVIKTDYSRRLILHGTLIFGGCEIS